jgi:hypothetical protein
LFVAFALNASQSAPVPVGTKTFIPVGDLTFLQSLYTSIFLVSQAGTPYHYSRVSAGNHFSIASVIPPESPYTLRVARETIAKNMKIRRGMSHNATKINDEYKLSTPKKYISPPPMSNLETKNHSEKE